MWNLLGTAQTGIEPRCCRKESRSSTDKQAGRVLRHVCNRWRACRRSIGYGEGFQRETEMAATMNESAGVTKDKLFKDMQAVVDDAESLLAATASQAGEKVQEVR